MFTHLVSLKRSPWFIYAQSEKDSLNICSKYGDHVVGVVVCESGLIMQEVHNKLTLSSPDIKLLDKIVEAENAQIAKEILEEENEETMVKDKELISQ